MAVGSMSGHSLATSTARVVLVSCVTGLAGVVAASGEASPTGQRMSDRLLIFLMATAITWLGATAPWWMITALGVVTAVLVGPSAWIVPAVVAVGVGIVRRWPRWQRPWLGAIGSGSIVVSLVHLRFDPFFGASAIAAGVIAIVLAVTGVLWRGRRARLVTLGAAIGVFLIALLATGGVALAAFNARGDLEDGYNTLDDGLDQLNDGDSA